MYIIFASYGNDSIALIQYAKHHGLKDVTVVYSNTGWAVDYWPMRVDLAERWVRKLGFTPARTKSEGMAGLLKRKKAWPRGGGGKFQFCTEALKQQPALDFLDEVDPGKEATCLIGIRREESRNRSNHPERIESSEAHGGRELWVPLVRHTEVARDILIDLSPFRVLPYKSKECWPCVNANKKELKRLEESKIKMIEVMEEEAGINSKGNARVMFSPKRHNNAIGIREVVADAKKNSNDMFESKICSSGWCNE